MPNKVYDNFFLSNEVEDQFNSHLDLQRFCTIDRNLVGTAGMTRRINVYKATNGTEKLGIGEGNTKSITVDFGEHEYEILLAQNRFEYHDEEAMTDPNIVLVGTRHMATDMFNTVNADIFAEYNKATLSHPTTAFDFGAFVDAQALLNIENLEDVTTFGFVCPADMAKVRKSLKDDLKFVEAFAKNGYVGPVGGTHLYTKKDATPGEIIIATKEAVTLFVKKGAEVEQVVGNKRSEAAANKRLNTIFARKYYIAALTNATKVVKLILNKGTSTTPTTGNTNPENTNPENTNPENTGE